MRTIARFMDARNTTEGKFLSVLLSVLLVFSFLNVTMFTDYANAEDEEGEAIEFVEPAAEPGDEVQPEDEAGELEKETESPTEGSENEGAPVEVQPESGDPEEEVSGTETETEGDGEQKDNLVCRAARLRSPCRGSHLKKSCLYIRWEKREDWMDKSTPLFSKGRRSSSLKNVSRCDSSPVGSNWIRRSG